MTGIEHSPSASQKSSMPGPSQSTKDLDAAQSLLQLSQPAPKRDTSHPNPTPVSFTVVPTNYNGFASREEELWYIKDKQSNWNPYLGLVSILWLGHKLRDATKSDDFDRITSINRGLTRDQYIR